MIPGVITYHPRSEWEPWAGLYTVASMDPPRQNPTAITQPVAHYTAADNLIDGDPGEHADNLPKYIAAIQRDYAINRGYSIGYLFAIDWLGGVWELRGFDYKAAANFAHNDYTAPILMLVDGADPLTAEAAAAARAVWREFRRRALRPDFKQRPLGHGELYLTTGVGTPTACPGAGILGQLHSGILDLDYNTQGETEMKAYPADRLLDTRGPAGSHFDDNKLPPGSVTEIKIPGISGVAAAQLTFTALRGDAQGFMTVWAGGERPETSFNNYAPGQPPIPETLFVPVRSDGSFSLYTSARVHVLVDFTGICLV